MERLGTDRYIFQSQTGRVGYPAERLAVSDLCMSRMRCLPDPSDSEQRRYCELR